MHSSYAFQSEIQMESVMCDVMKIRLNPSLFLGVSFTTSPLILLFRRIFYDVTHDTFRISYSSAGRPDIERINTTLRYYLSDMVQIRTRHKKLSRHKSSYHTSIMLEPRLRNLMLVRILRASTGILRIKLLDKSSSTRLVKPRQKK